MVLISNALAGMGVLESFVDLLPKNEREKPRRCGAFIHYISDPFSADYLLDCIKFSLEHQALEMANRIEFM